MARIEIRHGETFLEAFSEQRRMANGINPWKTAPGILIRRVERALLCVGCLLLAIVTAARIDRAIWLRIEVSDFRAEQLLSLVSRGSRDNVDARFRSETRNLAYRTSRREAPALLAILRIPRAHLEVPVLEGTSALSLNRGVGHISGTAKPGQEGNTGIAGHRDGSFRLLRFVGVGDSIELEGPDRIFTYHVNQLRIVNPGDVEVLNPREVSSLTLITCYPFNFIGRAPRRYVVEAALTGVRIAHVSLDHQAQVSSTPTLQLQ